jgi:hypothetical protein
MPPHLAFISGFLYATWFYLNVAVVTWAIVTGREMDFRVKQVEKYGRAVWQNPTMDKLRQTQCLCLNCGNMKECDTAKALYEICVKGNLALAVTRCPEWRHKTND